MAFGHVMLSKEICSMKMNNLQKLEKLDHTLCLNLNVGNLKFYLDEFKTLKNGIRYSYQLYENEPKKIQNEN